MKHLKVLAILLPLALALLAGCGGGGGGGGGGGSTVQITGTVRNVLTDDAPNPQAQVETADGKHTAVTSQSDGTFSISVPAGTTTLLVDTHTDTGGVFTFTIPAAASGQDVGFLYVGPEKVTVTGTVRDGTNNNPVPNATVSFAGTSGVTNANGVFTLANVAYSSDDPTYFQGIEGTVNASGYFANSFTVGGAVAVSGVVAVDDIPLVPSNGTNPPGSPYNIYGKVSPSAEAANTTVTLKQGATTVRTTVVGSDGYYYFWVPAGTYTISFANGSHTAPDQSVTLTQSNQVVEKDVTLD